MCKRFLIVNPKKLMNLVFTGFDVRFHLLVKRFQFELGSKMSSSRASDSFQCKLEFVISQKVKRLKDNTII